MNKTRWLLVVGLAIAVTIGLGSQPSLTQQKEIVIGGPISLSGKFANEGQMSQWGFKAVEKWVNEVYGGVSIGGQKIPIKYIYYDDESKSETVTSLLERLITVDGVKFILAPYSSPLTLAGAPVAEKYKVLYMAHGGASDRIFEQGYKYIVQTITLGSKYQVSPLDMVKALDPDAKKVALLFKDDEFSRSVMKGAKEYIEKGKHFEIVFERTYPTDAKDLTPVLTEMKAKAPEVVIGGGHFADGQLFWKQVEDLGIQVRWISLLVAPALPAFYDALGKKANGVASPGQWEVGVKFSPETAKPLPYFGPTQDEFLKLFREFSKGEDPSYHAAEAAAGLLAYIIAIEKADSLEVDKVRAAMNELNYVTFFGAWKIEPETGKQIAHEMVVIQWQNGKKEIVWPVAAQTAKPCFPLAKCPGR